MPGCFRGGSISSHCVDAAMEPEMILPFVGSIHRQASPVAHQRSMVPTLDVFFSPASGGAGVVKRAPHRATKSFQFKDRRVEDGWATMRPAGPGSGTGRVCLRHLDRGSGFVLGYTAPWPPDNPWLLRPCPLAWLGGRRGSRNSRGRILQPSRFLPKNPSSRPGWPSSVPAPP